MADIVTALDSQASDGDSALDGALNGAQNGAVDDSELRSGPRILILYSDIGGGHLSSARTLRDDILAEQPDAEIFLENGFQELGRFLCWFMRDLYQTQLSRRPWLYKWSYEVFRRIWFLRGLGALVMSLLGGRAELRLVRSYSPDIIISTDARLNAVLGRLKRAGKLNVPIFATLTDLGGLEFWTHKGIDLHLVMDSSCLESVEHMAGPGAACQVRPLVAPAFYTPLSREEARELLHLPRDPRIALVSGGGWGVGDLVGAIESVLKVPGAVAVCITGNNSQARWELDDRFFGDSRVVILGFTTQVNELMAACDVVIHSTAGVTYLEALVRSRPVITYKPPGGHPALIASLLAERGDQILAATPSELCEALKDTFAKQPDDNSSRSGVPSAAATILSAPARVRPQPLWQRIALRATAVATLVLMLAAFALLADTPYPVMARVLRLHTATAATHDSRSMPVVIKSTPSELPLVLADLESRGETASFTFEKGWTEEQIRLVEAEGSRVMPALGSVSLISWVHTRSNLSRQATQLGVHKVSVYIPPKDGLTMSEYLLARSKGAVPLRGGTYLESRKSNTRLSLSKDKLLIVALNSEDSVSVQFLDRVLDELSNEGLAAIPLENARS